MYKSNNLKNPKFWLGRATLVCVIFFVIGLISFMMNALSVTIVLGLVITCILLILITQVSELTIDESGIAIESKSLLPFLNSITLIGYNQINSLHVKSDQTMNDRGWLFAQRHNKNIVEVNYNQSECARIPVNLHPKGTNGIIALIESFRKVN
jgi:hypothetical protein